MAKTLGLGPDAAVPPIPRPAPTALNKAIAQAAVDSSREKRKLTDGSGEDIEPEDGTAADDSSKRTKTDSSSPAQDGIETNQPLVINQLPPLLSVLQPSDVQPPTLPGKAEMEGVILQLRKRALLEEYVGDAAQA